ncbi:hypothetical protein BGZ47_007653 [Haplosporangium gracile]|nr:hypothetical protein BGZ47_007653 [Haplosporangium gracile]
MLIEKLALKIGNPGQAADLSRRKDFCKKKGVPKYHYRLSNEANDLLKKTLQDDSKTPMSVADLVVYPFLTDGPIPERIDW